MSDPTQTMNSTFDCWLRGFQTARSADNLQPLSAICAETVVHITGLDAFRCLSKCSENAVGSHPRSASHP